MWHLQTDITGVLKVLGAAKGEAVQGTSVVDTLPDAPPGAGRVHLLWAERPTAPHNLPAVFVTAPGGLREFLAWTSTYLDGYRPLTSLSRVMDWESFERSRATTKIPDIREVEAACASLSVAEALTHGRGKVDASSVNIPSCESTYSFCQARTLAMGLSDAAGCVKDKWRLARMVARQPERHPTLEDIDAVWRVIRALQFPSDSAGTHAEQTHAIRMACRELIDSGEVTVARLSELLPGNINVGAIIGAMTETREQRVLAFEECLRAVVAQSAPMSPSAGFFCGYLASLLNPGSLEYLGLVTTHLPEHPMLLMWYALAEGLHPRTRVLNQNGGFFRRILRDIRQTDTLLSSPQCDISIDELEVLSATGNVSDYIRTGNQASVRVELHPFVVTTLRLYSHSQADQQPSLFSSPRKPDVDAVLREVQFAIRNLESVYHRLSGRDASSHDEEPSDSSSPKKRRGRKS